MQGHTREKLTKTSIKGISGVIWYWCPAGSVFCGPLAVDVTCYRYFFVTYILARYLAFSGVAREGHQASARAIILGLGKDYSMV